MKIGAYIIHLERAAARLPQVKRMLAQIPMQAQVVDAVDATALTEGQLSSYQPRLARPFYPFRLNRAEIAVFHSHRACWRRLLADGLEAALILEDDVALSEPQFSAALDLTMQHLAPADLVRFAVKPRDRFARCIAQTGATHLTEPRTIGLGMQAQIVTRDAAESLLRQTGHFDRPVDTYLQMHWLHGIRTLAVSPSGIGEISAQLGGSLISQKPRRLDRLHREVMRPIYRFGVLLRSLRKRRP